MVWVGVTSSGMKTPMAFAEDGVKINQHVNLNMLKDNVVSWIFALILINGWTIQQDGVTAHTAKIAQAIVPEELHRFLVEGNVVSFFTRPLSHGLWNMLQIGIERFHSVPTKCGSFEEKISRSMGPNSKRNYA